MPLEQITPVKYERLPQKQKETDEFSMQLEEINMVEDSPEEAYAE